MPAKCINRRCILLNLVYNLALNNIVYGVALIVQGTKEDAVCALCFIFLGILLAVGVKKDKRDVILSFLTMEVITLLFHSYKVALHVFYNSEKVAGDIFSILPILGLIATWLLMYPTWIIFDDLNKKQNCSNQAANSENCDKESIKNAPV